MDSPDVADLIVYGVLRSTEGLPMHDEMIKTHDIYTWYTNVQEALKV